MPLPAYNHGAYHDGALGRDASSSEASSSEASSAEASAVEASAVDPGLPVGVTEPDSDALLDEAWLSAPGRRSRLRAGLLVLLVLALAFLGGVEVHKRFGVASATGFSAPAAAGGGGMPSGMEGFGAGAEGAGFGAGGMGPGGSTDSGSATSSGTSGSSDTSSGAASGTSVPVVIGTVVSAQGRSWTVRDLGGTVHQVRITAAATITEKYGAGAVRKGATVAITGTTTKAGVVRATSVTVS